MKQIFSRKKYFLPGDRINPDGPALVGRSQVNRMKKQIHLLESQLREQESEISAMRQILITHPIKEYWEVPG